MNTPSPSTLASGIQTAARVSTRSHNHLPFCPSTSASAQPRSGIFSQNTSSRSPRLNHAWRPSPRQRQTSRYTLLPATYEVIVIRRPSAGWLPRAIRTSACHHYPTAIPRFVPMQSVTPMSAGKSPSKRSEIHRGQSSSMFELTFVLKSSR